MKKPLKTNNAVSAFIREEWTLFLVLGASLVFLLQGRALFSQLADPLIFGGILLGLFAVILAAALAVVRHADALAVRLGEPYGTLLLTLCVTSIEIISIATVVSHGQNEPTLVRDSLFAVVMIILNGMVGLALLIGAWRHHEQQYNLQGANTYLGVIIPLVVMSLVLPDFTVSTPGRTLSFLQGGFLILMSVGLYGIFLAIQISRHRGYFVFGDKDTEHGHPAGAAGGGRLLSFHAILLVVYMMPVVYLAEQLAHPVKYLIETLHAPVALGGVIMALLVATPEAISAVRAAKANHLQRSINISLGSVLSTISLTVPAMLIIAYWDGRNVVLGLSNTDVLLLLLTLTVSIVTFASGRTNVLQGAVHLLLFAAYLLLIFEG